MATLIALFLVLTIAVTLVALPAANAHTPAWTIPTTVYVIPAPKTVGLGQYMTFVMLNTLLPPGSGVSNDYNWRGFTLTLTKPDGTTEKLGPFVSESTGSCYTTYTPDQIGNWTVKLDYPGQVYGVGFITPGPYTGVYANDTFSASSYTTTFKVQQEPLKTEPLVWPLPTEYWTRPIEGQNQEWAKIASNWLGGAWVGGVGGGSANLNFQMDGIAPNSAHIMWSKPIEDGGVVGGNRTGGIEGNVYYDGSFYNLRFQSSIIMNGRLYYQLPLGNAGGGNGYMCLDLRTGEQIWYSDAMGVSGRSAPSFGYLYDFETGNQHGVSPSWLFTSNFARAVDPTTGKFTFNVTGVPSGTEAIGPAGEILRYTIANAGNATVPAWRLTSWNSSKVFQAQTSGLINLTAQTTQTGKGYDWNVSITGFGVGMSSPSIQAIQYNDLILGRNGSVSTRLTYVPYITYWAISLKPASRGTLLWMKNIPAPPNNMTWITRQAAEGVWILQYEETQQWLGYDMHTGNLLWGPTTPEVDYSPFGYFSGTSTVSTVSTIAYGKFFSYGQSGMCFCYDLYNGSLLWRYEDPTNKTVWNYYPKHLLAVADGKLYFGTNEHSSSKPLFKGNKVTCVDVNTGKLLWALDGWGSLHAGAVADGYLVYYNSYDNQIYCIGKGPSATTVEAPMTAVTAGDNVVIRGTVTDQSPGSKAKGTAAVSDASMGEWMAYKFMQKPIPTNTTGVEVTLDAVDPNGNFVHLGTATSDMSGTFGYMWTTPDVPGKYTIIATFAGTESYWPSWAETYTAVSEAPPATPPPPAAAPLPPFDMYILAATVAIIIAVAIVGLMILRKRP